MMAWQSLSPAGYHSVPSLGRCTHRVENAGIFSLGLSDFFLFLPQSEILRINSPIRRAAAGENPGDPPQGGVNWSVAPDHSQGFEPVLPFLCQV